MTVWPRKIIHLDLDAFFCAVEELRNPELKGKPFAVGGRPDERGVVSSCSYPARRKGVHSAMPMGQAMRLCPGLIIVSGHYSAYKVASGQVMERLHRVSPLVEQISIDEAFLDISDREEDPGAVAARLQAQIRGELSLPCSLGVATNKLIAKMASDFGKSQRKSDQPPNALTVVPPGEEASFIAPLDVEALWGVGPKTASALAELGVKTIGDLARLPAEGLAERFGKMGWELAERAKGIDDRPLETEHEARSISQETTFTRDVADGRVLIDTLHELAANVARQLTRHELFAVTVRIKLRWPDFTTISRQVTVQQPFQQGELIAELAEELFARAWEPGQPVRLIGVGVSGLSKRPAQISLWEAPQLEAASNKKRRLQDTLDDLRQRFGDHVLRSGAQTGDEEEATNASKSTGG